jgi:hypothetical protein
MIVIKKAEKLPVPPIPEPYQQTGKTFTRRRLTEIEPKLTDLQYKSLDLKQKKVLEFT